MGQRERPPTVYVLADTGYRPAGRFRARLERYLRAVEPNARVRLLRPHTQRGIDREIGRASAAHLKQFPDHPWTWGIEVVRTPVEKEFDAALQAREPVRLALVVLVGPDTLGDSPHHSPIGYALGRFVEAFRSDLLIPIVVDKPYPTPRETTLGDRLVAATTMRDWRSGTWTELDLADVARAAARALSTPLPPGRWGARGREATLDIVRVDANGGGDCYRIAEGLALAKRGGRVEVAPGTYLESPTIARSVHLVGIGDRDAVRVVGSHIALSTKLQFRTRAWPGQPQPLPIKATVENVSLETAGGESWGSTVWLNGGHVSFRDCTIMSSPGREAISDLGNAGENELRGAVQFTRCIIRGGSKGAQFGSRGPFRFTDCVFLGTNAEGQTGLAQYYDARGVVERCTFVDLRWGIQAQSRGHIDVRHSLIAGGLVGIDCGCRVEANIQGVTVRDAIWGVQAHDDTAVRLSASRFEDNRSGDLVVKQSARLTGWGNNFTRIGGPAIWVAGNAECLLADCAVRGASWGAFVTDDAALELVGSNITGIGAYAAGAAGSATLIARGNRLDGHENGLQFTEHSSGEVSENDISGSREYGIGVWSDGEVVIGENSIGRAGRHRVFVSRPPADAAGNA